MSLTEKTKFLIPKMLCIFGISQLSLLKMQFEKDKEYITIQILTVVLFLLPLCFIASRIAHQNDLYHFSLSELVFTNLILDCLIFFFVVTTVQVQENNLVFKNIFDHTLKKICLTTIKKKKVTQSNAPYKLYFIFFLWSLFGNKYSQIMEIRLFIADSKSYRFNGNILSDRGLKDFSRKI